MDAAEETEMQAENIRIQKLLPPYKKSRLCIKCHSKANSFYRELNTSTSVGIGSFYSGEHRSWIISCFRWQVECVHRVCKECSYQWFERPLDVKVKKAIK